MKTFKTLIILCLCFAFFQASAQKRQSVYKLNRKLKKVENIDSLLEVEVGEVQRFYKRSVFFRKEIVNFVTELNADEEKPLGAQNLNFLKSNTNRFMKLRDSLYFFTFKYENAMKISQSFLKKKNITEFQRTKAVMLSTACALMLYDNYLLAVVLMEQDDRIRRIANDPDIGFGVKPNQLRKVSRAANSVKNQKRILKGIKFLERRTNMFASEKDAVYVYLSNLIDTSPSKDYLKQIDESEGLSKSLRLSNMFISDLFAEIGTSSMNDLSKFFGNTAGMVATRKGIMYDDLTLKNQILEELQPLDILLEKTPFRLTDKFIPGYFGHVAIWVGNGQEMVNMNVWNHEVVSKHHEDLAPKGNLKSQDGKYIIEALREGVKMSTLDEFLNVDDFVILRPKFPDGMELEEKKKALLLAFRQVGKEYDFNFDINTTEKIVCSELAFICFPTIEWPTEKMVGRHTISPDNVASLVWESDQLELISFYRNGVKLKEDEDKKVLKELILAEQE